MLLDCNIVLQMNECAGETAQLAFDELKSLWQRRFGVPATTGQAGGLLVVFTVDASANGFSVYSTPGRLCFMAGSEIEILYAVYEFAEEFLGYCFFAPGQDRIDNAAAAIDLPDGQVIANRRPLLARRGFIQEFPFSADNYLIGDWMAKNKLNYLMTWMRYYDEMPREMKDFYRVRGIEIESGHHNFNYWIPPEKYHREHPEFFAVRNGRRISPANDGTALLLSEQLCTTNPDLRAEIVKNMVEYCRKNPEVKTISLIPNDGFGWCECETCSRFYNRKNMGEFYSVSEHVYRADRIYHDMVKDVVNQLRRQLPEINVTFCAYVNYSAPSEGFRLEKNMAVHFAPYWRCVNHRINDENCYTNSRYAADLERWLAAKSGGKVNIYEYYMGVNLYVSLPLVHHEDAFDEIAWYGEKGVDGILTQFHLPHWTAYGLNYYMMAKAAYGADKSVAVAAVMKNLFGDDWQLAGHFYSSLKHMVNSAGKCHIPYPDALFRRTSAGQFRDTHELATQLLQRAPLDEFRQSLVLWMEYLVRFKELFDRYRHAGINVNDVEAFRQWVHGLPPKNRILVAPKIDMLLDAWVQCLRTGREWLHFNLDWEDQYIRKHRETLK